jgi:isoquinoline 1-oxidoreductase beta subunit
MIKTKITRRDFLKLGAATGGGLLIGINLSACDKDDNKAISAAPAESISEDSFTPNAWIRIAPDNRVTLQVASSEMGQGIMTGIAMLLAEELDADWARVKAEFAPANSAYNNPLMGRQATGGSTAIRGFWESLRMAGAAAREVLVQAAAREWNVSPEACRTEKGSVIHDASKRKLSYGELARAASTLPVPTAVFLKEPDEFVLLGQPLPRLDTPQKTDGSAIFGIDIELPGLMTASIARCPVLGGSVKSFDASKTLSIPGVRHAIEISSGIAVIADHYWAAKKGRDALSIEWNEGPDPGLSSASIFAQFKQGLEKGGVSARDEGNVDKALKNASKSLEAIYEVPYQAHACMEPMNCTADVRNDSCDVYVPTQAQTNTQKTAMEITGLPEEKVKVHTTFLGGGFGRRSEQDFVRDALESSKAIRKPVKVIWSREDDMMHDQYRPATYNALRGGLDAQGRIVAWEHRIAGPSILHRLNSDWVKNGLDGTSIEGAKNIPYGIDNLFVSYAMVNPGVPVGFWRSVGSSQNAYITECFFDELAALAGRDPLEARLELMDDHPRHAGVLKLAAEKSGWGGKLPEGRARGIAVAESFGSYVAEVAEVSIDRGRVRVHRVTCAVDCGQTVNPNSIRAQMESAVVYGLTATLKGAITIKDGRVMQTNFDNYPLLSIAESPEIDVHIVKSDAAPGGIGEPGVPPAAPAVANAVFALTGKPVRSLPIRLNN